MPLGPFALSPEKVQEVVLADAQVMVVLEL